MTHIGNNGFGPKEINALVQARGFSKDPELIKKHEKQQKAYEEERDEDNERRAKAKEAEAAAKGRRDAAAAKKKAAEVPEDTTKFSVTKHNEGDGGEKPTKGTKIKAHYTGTLLDGAKFDSSVDRGTPFEFTLGVGQVIACWDKGFAELVKGQKATLICPPDLAYGARGAGGKIGPNATLKFEVELIDF